MEVSEAVEGAARVLVLVGTADGAPVVMSALPDGDFRVTVARPDTLDRSFAPGVPFDVIALSTDALNAACVDLVNDLRRRDAAIPLLVYATVARDAEIEAVLEAGADDCVVAPMSPQLVRTHIRVLLRRSSTVPVAAVHAGDITIEQSSRTLVGPNGRAHLTQREFELIGYLMSRPRTAVARAELLHRVWGFEFDPGTSVLDVTISRVRRKVAQVGGTVTLRSIRGVGFMLHSGLELAHPAL